MVLWVLHYMQRHYKLLIVSLLMLLLGWLGIGFGFGSSGLGPTFTTILFFGGLLLFISGIIFFILVVKGNKLYKLPNFS